MPFSMASQMFSYALCMSSICDWRSLVCESSFSCSLRTFSSASTSSAILSRFRGMRSACLTASMTRSSIAGADTVLPHVWH